MSGSEVEAREEEMQQRTWKKVGSVESSNEWGYSFRVLWSEPHNKKISYEVVTVDPRGRVIKRWEGTAFHLPTVKALATRERRKWAEDNVMSMVP